MSNLNELQRFAEMAIVDGKLPFAMLEMECYNEDSKIAKPIYGFSHPQVVAYYAGYLYGLSKIKQPTSDEN